MTQTASMSAPSEAANKDDRLAVWTRDACERDRCVYASFAAPGSRRSLARARVFIYSTQLRDWGAGGTTSIDEGPIAGVTLDDAARILIEYVQRDLQRCGTPAARDDVAFELFADRSWSLKALRDLHGQKEAKAIELQITDGAPRTICMGRPAYVTAPDVYRIRLDGQLAHAFGHSEIGIPLFGCLSVYADSTNTGRGRMWRSWCPGCLPSRAQRGRSSARAHVGRVRLHVQQRQAAQ
jgi:hypothetical protein